MNDEIKEKIYDILKDVDKDNVLEKLSKANDVLDDLNHINKLTSNDPGGMLATFWKDILVKNNLLDKLNTLIINYIENNKHSSNKKIHLSAVLKEATDTSISWKVFLKNIFNLLNPKKLTLIVRIQFYNGKESRHKMIITNKQTKNEKE